ncbi:MAG TPA: RING finger protein [Planctomycetaceae bacterium]|nr:RING finger protein [Planctomycetaceae bacterium]
MARIVTCSCGARVRVPEDARRALRCPRCKAALSLPAAAGALQTVTVRAGGTTAAGAVCPICQTDITAAEDVLTCPACDQVHHGECWGEIGGCGTYGCERAPPPVDKADADAQPRMSAWGDTKECPACGETIKAIALRCRYCKTEFDTVDPLTARDLRRRARRQDEFRALRRTVVWVFILSVVGLLAPIMVFVAPLVVLPRHAKLMKAGPIYAVLGYTAIALSVLYAVLWLGLLIAGS